MNLKMTIIFFSKTPDKSITQIEICFRTERQKNRPDEERVHAVS